MNISSFSNILLNKSPKKINNISENILNILFDINEFVREINSIDFCNPLGYILTKSLPPEGIIDNLLKNYGKKVSNFINISTNKIDLNNTSIIQDDIEELRLMLEELILPEELKDIIPGSDGLTEGIQKLNDILVFTNTSLSLNDKKMLLKSFTNRLIPLSNPVSLTEVLIENQVTELNNKISKFIKPERFRSDLIKIIKVVNNIDKSINQINNTIILINKIISSINVLIKIFSISIKILKKIPMPAKYVTVGVTVTSSSKVTKMENDINDLNKLLSSITKYLNTTIIKQIKRIRKEILILIVGLTQLLNNINSCKYLNNDNISNNLNDNILILNNNLILLNNIFPNLDENNINNSYKGYKINILKEETTDNNTSLIRKRVIVSNSNDIIEYEGTSTYSNNDQILIKEGQYFIDLKDEYNDINNNLNSEDFYKLIKQTGLNINNLEEINKKEQEVSELLLSQINSNMDDKNLYNFAKNDNNSKIPTIKKIINIILKKYSNNYIEINKRLQTLNSSLLRKGYTPKEISEAYKYSDNSIYNITYINNKITITKK